MQLRCRVTTTEADTLTSLGRKKSAKRALNNELVEHAMAASHSSSHASIVGEARYAERHISDVIDWSSVRDRVTSCGATAICIRHKIIPSSPTTQASPLRHTQGYRSKEDNSWPCPCSERHLDLIDPCPRSERHLDLIYPLLLRCFLSPSDACDVVSTWKQAADSCTETCIGSNSLRNVEVVNACMRRCEGSLPVLDQTVQQELTNLQVRKRRRFQSPASRFFPSKEGRLEP